MAVWQYGSHFSWYKFKDKLWTSQVKLVIHSCEVTLVNYKLFIMSELWITKTFFLYFLSNNVLVPPLSQDFAACQNQAISDRTIGIHMYQKNVKEEMVMILSCTIHKFRVIPDEQSVFSKLKPLPSQLRDVIFYCLLLVNTINYHFSKAIKGVTLCCLKN